MSTFEAPPAPPVDVPVVPDDDPIPPPDRVRLSRLQVAVLLVAIAFLAGAIGFVVGERGASDPLSDTDVGFLQDMGFHHDQALQMSLLLLDKPEIDGTLRDFAQEIIIGQRYEQGLFTATLDRFGHETTVGDTVMGWMGEPMPTESMTGLATEEQMDELAAAEGDEAAALWIALMSEHHLAGLHMADWEARYGSDRTVVNLAEATVTNQRAEIKDLARYRERVGLPIPDGFSDPTQDQRLTPLSLTDGD